VNPVRRRRLAPLRLPRMPAPAAKRAADLFSDLHWGIKPKRLARVRAPSAGPALAELGRLESVEYSTEKQGDGPSIYHHEFGEEGGRKPHLAVDPATRDLHIVGGSYTVETGGIID
jgi:hypothetical protein